MEFLSGLIGAIVGAVFGALATSYFTGREQQRQNQILTTLRLYEQYEMTDMLQSRIKATALFKQALESKSPLSIRELMATTSPEEWQHMSRLLHFFEQVAVLFEADYLDKKLFQVTLAVPFREYYKKYIQPLDRIAIQREEQDFRWTQPVRRLAEKLELAHFSEVVPGASADQNIVPLPRTNSDQSIATD
ncbi:MAG: hypothetical protein MUD01_15010 [Chloroflexaceae bacterium]|jgi:hypothetical protein|nr:hypothetical protein [Chloroflexaceae bacterium]